MNLRMLLILFFSLGSCSSVQAQARAANELAIVVNRMRPELIQIYREEGIRRIRSAADRSSAERSLAELRVQWRPLWGECDEMMQCQGGSYEALREAHDFWATLLERQIAGQQMSLSDIEEAARRLTGAYCSVRSALPPESRSSLPVLPGVNCP